MPTPTSGVVDEYTPGGPAVGTPLGTPTLQSTPGATLSNFSSWSDAIINGIGNANAVVVGTGVAAAQGASSAGAAVASIADIFTAAFWAKAGIYVIGGVAVYFLFQGGVTAIIGEARR